MDASGAPIGVEDVARTYVRGFAQLLEQLDFDAVARIIDRIDTARHDGATIYLAGNGGSAATAAHWANDLNKAAKRDDAPPIRAINLSDNVPWFSALANDEGYERVFAGQLESLARPGDVLVVISASGNSPNLVNAVSTARAQKAGSLGLLGFDGGLLRMDVDDYVLVQTPSGAYGPVETMHSLLCDVMTSCLARQLAGERSTERV